MIENMHAMESLLNVIFFDVILGDVATALGWVQAAYTTDNYHLGVRRARADRSTYAAPLLNCARLKGTNENDYQRVYFYH